MSDPLDDLRRAWRDLDAPALDRAPDATTRAAVEWMRAAWAELEAPPLRARPARRRGLPVAAGAAAALALWLGLALLDAPSAPGPGRPTAVEPRELPLHASFRPPTAVHAGGGVELRSGAVTLILLDDSTRLGERSGRAPDVNSKDPMGENR